METEGLFGRLKAQQDHQKLIVKNKQKKQEFNKQLRMHGSFVMESPKKQQQQQPQFSSAAAAKHVLNSNGSGLHALPNSGGPNSANSSAIGHQQ